VTPEEFRERLQQAVDRVGRKTVLLKDGVTEGGLSKVLSGDVKNPGIFTVKAIAEGAGETIGSLLGEDGHELSAADRAQLRAISQQLEEIAQWIAKKLGQEGSKTATPVTTPKQSPSGGATKHLQSTFDAMARAAGVPRFTPHALRRSGYTWLAEAGVERIVRKVMMGHQTGIDVSDLYDRSFRARMVAAAAVFDGIYENYFNGRNFPSS
jgi:integrase